MGCGGSSDSGASQPKMGGKGLGKLCIKYFDLPGRKEPLMFLVNYAKIAHDFVGVEQAEVAEMRKTCEFGGVP
jgi:hypothetical protein